MRMQRENRDARDFKKKSVVEENNDFDELICRLDATEEGISQREMASNEPPETRKQREWRLRRKT